MTFPFHIIYKQKSDIPNINFNIVIIKMPNQNIFIEHINLSNIQTQKVIKNP